MHEEGASDLWLGGLDTVDVHAGDAGKLLLCLLHRLRVLNGVNTAKPCKDSVDMM